MHMKKEYSRPSVDVFVTPPTGPFVLCASPIVLAATSDIRDWENDTSWGSLF